MKKKKSLQIVRSTFSRGLRLRTLAFKAVILNHNCILQPLKEMLGTLMPGLHPRSSDLIGLERSAEYNNFF